MRQAVAPQIAVLAKRIEPALSARAAGPAAARPHDGNGAGHRSPGYPADHASAARRSARILTTIGFQSFAQIKQVYGEGAQTIIENCGNLLLLRAGASEDGGTAKLASELIGGREVEHDDVSRSRAYGRYTTRSSSTQTRRGIEDVALASEIMQLGNREGFLKLATAPSWMRVQFPYVSYRQ